MDKEAAATGAEDIEEDDHHPHAKRRRHDEVFGARATDLLQFCLLYTSIGLDDDVIDVVGVDYLALRLHGLVAGIGLERSAQCLQRTVQLFQSCLLYTSHGVEGQGLSV